MSEMELNDCLDESFDRNIDEMNMFTQEEDNNTFYSEDIDFLDSIYETKSENNNGEELDIDINIDELMEY